MLIIHRKRFPLIGLMVVFFIERTQMEVAAYLTRIKLQQEPERRNQRNNKRRERSDQSLPCSLILDKIEEETLQFWNAPARNRRNDLETDSGGNTCGRQGTHCMCPSQQQKGTGKKLSRIQTLFHGVFIHPKHTGTAHKHAFKFTDLNPF